MREFAEAEIVLPNGPYAGRAYSCATQPYSGLFFDAVDSGAWRRIVATGPTQSGKTLTCFVIPVLWHLFEIGETVICGLPDLDMAADKWNLDVRPVIERTRYREFLPTRGGGSRGGVPQAIQFTHGPVLRFMGGGGGDKQRAAFTSRVLVVTETDGMDEAGAASREADKLAQLEGRTRAFGQRARVYMECTLSIDTGRTYREISAGTNSRIALPCPHCRRWVTPERENLIGWADAASVPEARRLSRFACPSCGRDWTDAQRSAANARGALVHRGQKIQRASRSPGYRIVGAPPETETLGFRWSAVNNQFATAGDLGVDEWEAARSDDEDNAEREMRQFVWALPVERTALDMTSLDSGIVQRQVVPGLARGIAPPESEYLTIGVDLGKWLANWIAIAWAPNGTGHIVDYGRFEVPSREIEVERAVFIALNQFREFVDAGWRVGIEDALTPDQVWIDSGYLPESVYAFCRGCSGQVWRPAKGFGSGQDVGRRYYGRPQKTSPNVRHIGDHYHLTLQRKDRILLVETDSDHWKSYLHRRLATPDGEHGRLTIFDAPPAEHLSLAKQLTAERQIEEFVPGKGTLTRWEVIRRENHYLDAGYLACAAGHFAGVRILGGLAARVREAPRARPLLTAPDGRPYLVTERR